MHPMISGEERPGFRAKYLYGSLQFTMFEWISTFVVSPGVDCSQVLKKWSCGGLFFPERSA